MKKGLLIFLFFCPIYLSWMYLPSPIPISWDEDDIFKIKSLSISQLKPLPVDPSNSFSDNEKAAIFGHMLFFDKRLSKNSQISCASCHQPSRMFTDGKKIEEGLGVGIKNTPTIIGISFSPWFYWNGRKDSQWSQALEPLESNHEHGSNRSLVAQLIFEDNTYSNLYNEIFGNSSKNTEVIFSNIGKALAAYQRKLIPGESKFDKYVNEISSSLNNEDKILSYNEKAGLNLFINKGQCINCHNGPLFTNNSFHNTGLLSIPGQLPSLGRVEGLKLARLDPFNCLGKYSNAKKEDCQELTYAGEGDEFIGAHKTPTLRNISLTSPYMHAGQLESIALVIDHYNIAPEAMIGHNEAKPLNLRPIEKKQLEAFLNTLISPLVTEKKWLLGLPKD